MTGATGELLGAGEKVKMGDDDSAAAELDGAAGVDTVGTAGEVVGREETLAGEIGVEQGTVVSYVEITVVVTVE